MAGDYRAMTVSVSVCQTEEGSCLSFSNMRLQLWVVDHDSEQCPQSAIIVLPVVDG